MHRGYIKLWRKLFESKIHRNHKLFTLWVWLLANATYKSFEYWVGNQSIMLLPGQIITGRKRLAGELGMSEQNIRSNLYSLKKANMITIKTTKRFSVITIVNWHTYQERQFGLTNQTTTIQHTANQQVTTKQEGKKNKEVKKYSIDSIEFRLAKQLLTNIVSVYPGFKIKNFNEWVFHIDKAIHKDNRSSEEIKQVIDWCQQHHFWRSRIISTEKLRQHFDQLILQMRSECEELPNSDHETAANILKFNGHDKFVAFCKRKGLATLEVQQWITNISQA
jgi:hypothetical protein